MQPESDRFTTTLRKISSFDPCSEGWEQLTTALGTTAPDAEVSLAFILNSNGINDAIWALRCFDYKDYCLFTEDVAESVAHLNPDPRVSAAIAAVRAWHKGQISEEELVAATDAARAAVDSTARAAAAYAAYAAYASTTADAGYTAVYAAHAAHAAYASQWGKITELFIEHFC